MSTILRICLIRRVDVGADKVDLLGVEGFNRAKCAVNAHIQHVIVGGRDQIEAGIFNGVGKGVGEIQIKSLTVAEVALRIKLSRAAQRTFKHADRQIRARNVFPRVLEHLREVVALTVERPLDLILQQNQIAAKQNLEGVRVLCRGRLVRHAINILFLNAKQIDKGIVYLWGGVFDLRLCSAALSF